MADRVKTSDLKSRFLHLAQTSVFTVKLQPPAAVLNYLRSKGFNYSIDGEGVELRCKNALLPGSNLETHDQMNDYVGMTERMASRRSFDRMQFEFYVDNKYDVIEMFDGWIEYISGQTTDEQSPYQGYRMNYPSTYKTNVFVSKFEKGFGNRKQRGDSYQMDYSLVNSFPITSMPMTVDYGQSNILSYQVQMEFTKYTKRRRTL
jgi:hypothetical protein